MKMTPILFEETATEFTTQGLGALTEAIDGEVTEKLNGEYELELKYPITGRRYSDLKNGNIIFCKPDPYRSGQPFPIYRITKPMNGVVTVYARHISYKLAGIPVRMFTASNAPAALAGLAQNAVVPCPFTFWTDKDTAANFSVSVPTACRALLGGQSGSILDVYGGEYEWDGFTVRLHTRRGQDNGVRIAYGKNLTDIEQDENISNLVTGVMGYWTDRDGNTVQGPVVNAPGTYSFTNIKVMDFSGDFEEQPTIEQLEQRTQKYIDDNNVGVPSVSISISWAQLEQYAGYEDKSLLERVMLGDTVTVGFTRLGVDATARVIETRYDPLNDRYKSAEIGSVKANIADTISGQQQDIQNRPVTSEVKKIANTIASILLGASGGCIRFLDTDGDEMPDTIYMADNPNPKEAKEVWRWNFKGWGASSNGYNGPFEMSAALGVGMYADFLAAGTLDCALIKVINLVAQGVELTGNFRTKNGNFFAELWAGIFTMGQNNGKVDNPFVKIYTSASNPDNGSGAVVVNDVANGKVTPKTQIIGGSITTEKVSVSEQVDAKSVGVGGGTNFAFLRSDAAIQMRSDTYGVKIGKYGANLNDGNWTTIIDGVGNQHTVFEKIS